jgi:hypothetical protein
MTRVSAVLKPVRWVPAVAVVDGVGEAEDLLLVAVVPLQGHLGRLLALAVVTHVLQVDGRRVERVLGAVQVLDEAGDAALVAELGGTLAALVLDLDRARRG